MAPVHRELHVASEATPEPVVRDPGVGVPGRPDSRKRHPPARSRTAVTRSLLVRSAAPPYTPTAVGGPGGSATTGRRHDGTLPVIPDDRARLHAAVLLGLVIVLAFGFQGSRGLWLPDEGYHASIARTMLASGDWLVPRLGGQVWLDKPPLSHWAIAAGLWLLGPNEWGARLANGLWYALTAWLVLALGGWLWDRRTGRLAALLYATMLLPFAAANVVTPDTPLTFWTTAAMASFWLAHSGDGARAERWKIVLGLALALGVWTKGPAALIPCAAMIAFLVATGTLRSFLATRGMVGGALTFLTVGLSWYAWVGASVPGALAYVWDNHVAGRLISDAYRRHPGIAGALEVYLPVLIAGTIPAVVALAIALPRRLRSVLRPAFWRHLRSNPPALLVLCWAVAPCIVLVFASSKLPLYLLPVFPAFALIFARLTLAEADARSTAVTRLGLPAPLVWPAAGWIVALLALKLAAGVVDSGRDLRRTAEELRGLLPPAPYEIVCVDLRCEGLAFYLDGAVERVILGDPPYPVFGGQRTLEAKLRELRTSSLHHVLLYDARHEETLRTRTARYGGRCAETGTPLSHRRHAMVCRPAPPHRTAFPPDGPARPGGRVRPDRAVPPPG